MSTMSLEALVPLAVAGDRAAAEALVEGVRDDVYHLALRMLGLRAEAEDATQEILIQVLTHLAQFRGESKFRTWVWRIAQRHVLAHKATPREALTTFENIERMIAAGDQQPPQLQIAEAELKLLAEETRLACTGAMIMSLDREHRIAWILGEVFELSSTEAADVLELDAAAYRKRLQRARDRLADWMMRRCGLVDPSNLCRCLRQVPVAHAAGVARSDDLQFASHPQRGEPRRRLPLLEEAGEIERAAAVLTAHPDYAAPPALVHRIRSLIDSGRYRMFDA
jgi:RNA polymerase sigma factor (sigma-70 family)